MAEFASASPLPVNVMLNETSPSPKALARTGVARLSYGPTPYLLAMKALEAEAVRQSRRRVAAMAHDPRIIDLVTMTADELEEDIRKLEAEASGAVTLQLEPPSEAAKP